MKEATDSALVPSDVARSRNVFDDAIDEISVETVSRSVFIASALVALFDVALFVSSSSESNWSSSLDTSSRWLRRVSSEERIDEEALEKSSMAAESVGTSPLTPVRAFDTAVCTELAAVDAEDRAVEIDVEDVDRSVFSVVRSVIAVDSDVLLFVRSVKAVPTPGRFPTPAVSRSLRTVPTVVLIELPSTSRPSSLPVAPCTAPSRLPASVDRPASASDVLVDRPSRTDPMSAEKSASEVRASVTSASAVSSDVDRSSAAVSSSPSVVRAEATESFAESIVSLIPDRLSDAFCTFVDASPSDVTTSARAVSA